MGTNGSRGTTSVAAEDYLEQILNLITEKGYARVVDIATNLNISQASVSNMVRRLDQEGLVNYEKYRGMVLTPDGERIARAIVSRHAILTEFLRLFSIDEDIIYHDVEGMEHHMSPETVAVFECVVNELQKKKALLKTLRSQVDDRLTA